MLNEASPTVTWIGISMASRGVQSTEKALPDSNVILRTSGQMGELRTNTPRTCSSHHHQLAREYTSRSYSCLEVWAICSPHGDCQSKGRLIDASLASTSQIG